MNNHTANIKSLNFHASILHHESYRLEDMFVQPIESTVAAPDEQANTYSKCLERIRELKSVYPHGLNDNKE